jgi:hypothetical protein
MENEFLESRENKKTLEITLIFFIFSIFCLSLLKKKKT